MLSDQALSHVHVPDGILAGGESRTPVLSDPSSRPDSSPLPVTSPRKPRVIVMHNGPSPLHHDPAFNPFHFLGRWLCGAAVYGCWVEDAQERRALISASREACGGFDYVPVPTTSASLGVLRPVIAPMRLYRAAVAYAEEHAGTDPVSAVVVYSPYWVGLAAALVAKRLRVPLVVQVPTDMRAAFHAQPGSLLTIKRAVAKRVARYVLESASAWNLYFPGQTGDIQPSSGQRVTYFPDFSPVSTVPVSEHSEKEFLLMGFPWSVKGVDLAIRAFREAGTALADWRLRVVGYCEDRSPYEALAAGDSRVIMQEPVLHTDALRMIASCGVFVLASRTEGIARVAVEAMAASRPVISTKVGGMPMFIEHEQSGLLIEPESVSQLRDAMIRLANDATLRERLGQAARARVLGHHSEQVWAQKLASIVQELPNGFAGAVR